MAKSIIKKVISRKIKTADFESLDVNVEVEEQIVWETEEERAAATAKLSERLLDDFTTTYNDVVNKISVKRCIGVVVSSNGKKSNGKKKEEPKEFSF